MSLHLHHPDDQARDLIEETAGMEDAIAIKPPRLLSRRPPPPSDRPWYEVKLAAEGEGEILIYDLIGSDWYGDGSSAKGMADALKALGDIARLDIRINSPGGSAWDGIAIYNVLRRHPAAKTVYVDGVALSAASLVAMAGDRIIMPQNAMMMIHDPWSWAIGT